MNASETMREAMCIGADIANGMNIASPATFRILVIDDCEDDVILLRHLLKHPEFIFDQASNVEASEAKLATRAHDLYLVDYRFHLTNGLDIIAKWRALVRGPMICWTGMVKQCVEDLGWDGSIPVILKDQLLDGTIRNDLRAAVANYRNMRASDEKKRLVDPIARVR